MRPETDRTLSYAPVSSGGAWKRWRRFFLRMAVGLLVLILLLVLLGTLPDFFAQRRYLAMQAACATYALPPGTVVYEDDPGAAPRLLASSPEYSEMMIPSSGPSRRVVIRQAACWEDYYTTIGPTDSFLARSVASIAFSQGATLFLHELRTTAGTRRIVAVQRTCLSGAPDDLEQVIMFPATWTRRHDIEYSSGGSSLGTSPAAAARFRYFAGQGDPADASHFSIRYEQDGRPGRIDGYLVDDAATGECRVRLVVAPAGP